MFVAEPMRVVGGGKVHERQGRREPEQQDKVRRQEVSQDLSRAAVAMSKTALHENESEPIDGLQMQH